MAVTRRNGSSFRVRVAHKGKRYEAIVHGTEDDATLVDTTMQWSIRRWGTWPPPEEAKSHIAALPGVILREPTKLGAKRNGTFTRAAERVLSGIWHDARAHKTQRSRLKVFMDWIKAEGIEYMEDFDEEKIQKWANWMIRRGLSANTRNNYMNGISALYREARKPKPITLYQPSLPYARVSHKRDRYMTREEEAGMVAFLREAGQVDLADAIMVACDTGLRRGELMRLTARSLKNIADPAKAAVVAPGSKTVGSYATLPLAERSRRILAQRAKEHPSGPLFPLLTPNRIAAWWNVARDHMGLADDPAFTFHVTRHTMVNRLLDAGVSINVVRDQARHGSIETTQLYEAHQQHRLDVVRRVFNRMDTSRQPSDQGQIRGTNGAGHGIDLD